jgi:hypothetical protein
VTYFTKVYCWWIFFDYNRTLWAHLNALTNDRAPFVLYSRILLSSISKMHLYDHPQIHIDTIDAFVFQESLCISIPTICSFHRTRRIAFYILPWVFFMYIFLCHSAIQHLRHSAFMPEMAFLQFDLPLGISPESV